MTDEALQTIREKVSPTRVNYCAEPLDLDEAKTLLAERDALSARLAEVQKFRDEAFSAGVEAVFDQVEDITHGNYDAETFRLRFHRSLGLEASPRGACSCCRLHGCDAVCRCSDYLGIADD